MISSSVSSAGPLRWAPLLVDGAMIYQFDIDKKRKFCVILIEMLNVFGVGNLPLWLQLIG
ncbi:hypothetical protein [Pseudomonas sp. NPDC088444]|uniref:hypothetical protein n=1 Tax=Pseudomonas sp. NPDC088444 TaxID=3364456 RepID=UPI00384E4D55